MIPDIQSLPYVAREAPTPPFHEVIILGNGFDLECDLHCTFSDFFSGRKAALESACMSGSSDDCLRAAGLTVWDVILDVDADLRQETADWCDIEAVISDFVTTVNCFAKNPPLGHHPAGAARNAARCWAQVYALLHNQDGYQCGAPHSWHGSAESKARPDWCIAWALQQQNPVPHTPEELASLLMAELREVEHQFATHMNAQIQATPGYAAKAARLMGQLVVADVPPGPEVHVSTISFNYTPVPVFDAANLAAANVHGTLERDDAVFGIDWRDCSAAVTERHDHILQFTKTSRVLQLDSMGAKKLVRQSRGFPGDGHTALIKVYGHSLNEADYSYFQALFDAVDLYGSDTRLIVYTRPFTASDGTKVTAEEARTTMMRKTMHLLSAYGATMDNRAHGMNLIQKMEIEGRLQVRILEDADAELVPRQT